MTEQQVREASWLVAAKAGNRRAKELILEKYAKLIYKMAIQFSRDHESFEDRVQDGQIALLKAIDKYDMKLGQASFFTYAHKVIWSEVYKAQRMDRLIHVPECILEDMRKDREHRKKDRETNPEYVKAANAAMSNMLSVDECYDLAKNVSEDTERSDEIRFMEDAISKLPVRSQYILRKRMDGLTLDAIGMTLGVCKERVRQISFDAMNKLSEILGAPPHNDFYEKRQKHRERNRARHRAKKMRAG